MACNASCCKHQYLLLSSSGCYVTAKVCTGSLSEHRLLDGAAALHVVSKYQSMVLCVRKKIFTVNFVPAGK